MNTRRLPANREFHFNIVVNSLTTLIVVNVLVPFRGSEINPKFHSASDYAVFITVKFGINFTATHTVS